MAINSDIMEPLIGACTQCTAATSPYHYQFPVDLICITLTIPPELICMSLPIPPRPYLHIINDSAGP